MASQATSATQKPPQLSYADRAKKGRNVTQNSPAVQRALSQPVSASSTATAISSVSSTSSTVSTVVSSSDTPKSFQPADVREQPPATSAGSNTKVASPISPVPPETTKRDAPGDVKEELIDSSSVGAPPIRPQKSAPPTVNVWAERAEKARIQSQAQSVPPSQKATKADSLDKTFPSLSSRPPDPQPGPTSSTTSTTSVAPIATKATQPQKPHVNGHHPSEDHADPFVVRPNLVQAVRPHPVVDANDWPSIGDSGPTSSRPPSHDNGDASIQDPGDQKERSDEKSAVSISRKGEKPKWVQIPPQELQAAADAQQPRHRPHRNGHSRSQYKGHPSASGSTSTAGSVSGQNSQGQSRTQSAMGTRQPGSHVSSVSHSQTQSRTGSAQSSPRQPSTRDGRKLPDELPSSKLPLPDTAHIAANRSSKSSRATSPQPQGRPHPPPSEDIPTTLPPLAALYTDPNVPQPLVPQHYDPPFQDMSHTNPYYAGIPPALSTNTSQSYHSTHASNSPASNPFPLPVNPPIPGMYAPPTISTSLPGHAPFPNQPPFPVYPPYEYQYGHPYMHWNQVPDGMSPYPLTPHNPGYPADTRNALEVPPTNPIPRPLPPAESDPVSTYRDISFTLPPAATYPSLDGMDQDRERRRTELSFGTIIPSASERIASPLQSPVVVESDSADISSSLGLDIGSSQEGETGIERSFTSFSIGVEPGELGPPRMRQRTRTQPKVTPVVRVRNKTAPADLGGHHLQGPVPSITGEGVEITGEAPTIGTEGQKWEFGTANHPEQDEQTQPQLRTMRDSLPPSFIPNVPYVGVPQPLVEAHPNRPSAYGPRMSLTPLTTPANGYPASHSPSSAGAFSIPSGVSPSGHIEPHNQEWEVKNYGWGFGQPNGAMISPVVPNQEQRHRDRDARDYPRDASGSRPRRGSYGGAYTYDNRGGHDRGGYSGRRGRGGNGGYGRGMHGRNFSRGGFQQPHQARPPSFAMNQTSPMPHPEPSPYFVPPPQSYGTTYFHPAGFDPSYYAPYQPMPPPPGPPPSGPPPPQPQTLVTFPLDDKRRILLGQLEYYLSAQNLAKDIFLRQNMDDHGWVPIALIATFRRIKSQTDDVHLVKDVLGISSLAEVYENWVRPRDWRMFVLPDALPSEVPFGPSDATLGPGEAADAESASHDGDEDDEVEIVLGSDGNRSWATERNSG